MGTRVLKSLLNAGTYFTGRGPVTFTSGDLAEMEATGNAMLRAGLAIPVPLEHQDSAGPCDHADRLAHSVRHNAGWVASFSLDEDGGLFAELDVEDEDIARKLPTTIRYVSPEVYPSFVDGSGRTWMNAITHVALTPRPVWAQQQPFGGDGAALLSLSAVVPSWKVWKHGPLRLSLADAWRFAAAIHNTTGRRLYGQEAARAVAAGRATPGSLASNPHSRSSNPHKARRRVQRGNPPHNLPSSRNPSQDSRSKRQRARAGTRTHRDCSMRWNKPRWAAVPLRS